LEIIVFVIKRSSFLNELPVLLVPFINLFVNGLQTFSQILNAFFFFMKLIGKIFFLNHELLVICFDGDQILLKIKLLLDWGLLHL
jgi:hypothetical protein